MERNVRFHRCTIDDLYVLQNFSRRLYFETFAEANTPENMQAYLDHAFALEKLREELLNPHSSFVFLYCNSELAGYMKLNEACAQTDVHDDESLEIERIYVDKKFQ